MQRFGFGTHGSLCYEHRPGMRLPGSPDRRGRGSGDQPASSSPFAVQYLLLLFVVVPLVELYLLLWVSTLIGFWATVALTLVTGVVGGSLAKAEGLRVWRAWRAAIQQLRPPEEGVIEGVLVLVGGVLLITPGILTDALGLCLLLPPTRRPIAARVRRVVDRRIQSATVYTQGFAPWPGAEPPRRPGGSVIDAEGEAVSDSGDAREPEVERLPDGGRGSG